jgi:hypothetical protein
MGAGIQPYAYNPSGNNPHLPTDLLSRWDWIDAETIASIVKGAFDLNNFPKLFREYADRQAHTITVTDGVHLPADGTRPYVVTTKTKLLSAFPSLAKFLSAWTVYCAVRCARNPEYASGFFHWQERLIYRARVHKDWSEVLNYIIKYFNRYQKAPPEAWFHPDSELITDCFVGGEKWPNASLRPARKPDSSSSEICQNWNNSRCVAKERNGRECSRRHICSNCQKDDHRAPNCPQAVRATKISTSKTTAP